MRFVGIGIGRPYDKGALVGRHLADVSYGRAAARAVAAFRPEVVVSGNTPTAAQGEVIRACRAAGAAFVLWVQDFYSVAVVAAAAPQARGRPARRSARPIGRWSGGSSGRATGSW